MVFAKNDLYNYFRDFKHPGCGFIELALFNFGLYPNTSYPNLNPNLSSPVLLNASISTGCILILLTLAKTLPLAVGLD